MVSLFEFLHLSHQLEYSNILLSTTPHTYSEQSCTNCMLPIHSPEACSHSIEIALAWYHCSLVLARHSPHQPIQILNRHIIWIKYWPTLSSEDTIWTSALPSQRSRTPEPHFPTLHYGLQVIVQRGPMSCGARRILTKHYGLQYTDLYLSATRLAHHHDFFPCRTHDLPPVLVHYILGGWCIRDKVDVPPLWHTDSPAAEDCPLFPIYPSCW
jgi:hypothetical protein